MPTIAPIAEALSKLQDALNELAAFAPHETPVAVYNARRHILIAQQDLEDVASFAALPEVANG